MAKWFIIAALTFTARAENDRLWGISFGIFYCTVSPMHRYCPMSNFVCLRQRVLIHLIGLFIRRILGRWAERWDWRSQGRYLRPNWPPFVEKEHFAALVWYPVEFRCFIVSLGPFSQKNSFENLLIIIKAAWSKKIFSMF